MSPIYQHPSHSLAWWHALASALLLVLIIVSVLAAKRQRYLAVGWFWFLGTLVPMIGLVQVGGQAMAHRYAYLPFLGLFIMAGGSSRVGGETAVFVQSTRYLVERCGARRLYGAYLSANRLLA